MTPSATNAEFRHADRSGPTPRKAEDRQVGGQLSASLLREKEQLGEPGVLTQQQDLMAEEFDHRLGNSLQMIVKADGGIQAIARHRCPPMLEEGRRSRG